MKFVNVEGDILLLNEINDGSIHTAFGNFEWEPPRYEFEPHLNPNRGALQNNKLQKALRYKLYGCDKNWNIQLSF